MFGIPLLGRPFSIMTAPENRKIMIGIIGFLLLLSLFWDFQKKRRENKADDGAAGGCCGRGAQGI